MGTEHQVHRDTVLDEPRVNDLVIVELGERHFLRETFEHQHWEWECECEWVGRRRWGDVLVCRELWDRVIE